MTEEPIVPTNDKSDECPEETENIDMESLVRGFLENQSNAMMSTLTTAIQAVKESGYEEFKVRVGDVAIDTTVKAGSKLNFSLGTLNIMLDDSRTSTDEKLDKIYEIIEKIVKLGIRPDRVLLPAEYDPDEAGDADEVQHTGAPMFQ